MVTTGAPAGSSARETPVESSSGAAAMNSWWNCKASRAGSTGRTGRGEHRSDGVQPVGERRDDAEIAAGVDHAVEHRTSTSYTGEPRRASPVRATLRQPHFWKAFCAAVAA